MANQVQAGNGTVRLAGVDLEVEGSMNEQDLARFAGKITQGDYSYDSDSLMSVYVISSLVGGIGNEMLKEGVDNETYWTGDLETRYPGMVTLLPETLTFPAPAGMTGQARPVADFPATAPSLFASFGTDLARWVEVDEEFVSVGSLGGTPSNKGVEQDSVLWIPLGQNGYATVTASFAITLHNDLDIIAFTLWDNKIAALTTGGALRIRTTLAGSWETDKDELHLPSGHLPRNLVVFYNEQDETTIHIVTNRDVWAYDRTGARLVRTQLQYPPHPDQGTASTVWRGESMYVSVGLGIHAYTGGIITGIGPDGRYGLPAALRGKVVDLEPEYNSLIAVVAGKPVDNPYDTELDLAIPTYRDDFSPMKEQMAKSTILRYMGYGWHPVWVSEGADGIPTWVHVCIADGNYRLWWGYGEEMFRQELRVTFHNPKAGMRVGDDRFAADGELISGWFDADMTGFDKLAAACEVTLTDVFDDGTPTGSISVDYQVDTQPGWSFLGKADQIGRTVMPFNVVQREIGDFSEGLRFRRIRFRFKFEGLTPYLSPILQSFLLQFIKVPLAGKSWRFTVKIDQERSFMGSGVRDTQEFIRLLASDGRFHEFIHQNKSYRVRVSQTNLGQKTGHDPRGYMTLSLVEIPLRDSQLKVAP